MVLGWLSGKGKAPAHTRSLTAIDELSQSVYGSMRSTERH